MLEELKNYLNITWDDVATDNKLQGFIDDGKAYLKEVAGTDLDFDNDRFVKSLLKDYCRYAYNHSLELFEVNFKRSLLKLSIREGVKAHAATQTDT